MRKDENQTSRRRPRVRNTFSVTTSTPFWLILFSLLICFSPSAFGQLIQVQSPNGGESWARGETHEIQWDPAMGRPRSQIVA